MPSIINFFVKLCKDEMFKGDKPGTSFNGNGWNNLVVNFRGVCKFRINQQGALQNLNVECNCLIKYTRIMCCPLQACLHKNVISYQMNTHSDILGIVTFLSKIQYLFVLENNDMYGGSIKCINVIENN